MNISLHGVSEALQVESFTIYFLLGKGCSLFHFSATMKLSKMLCCHKLVLAINLKSPQMLKDALYFFTSDCCVFNFTEIFLFHL